MFISISRKYQRVFTSEMEGTISQHVQAKMSCGMLSIGRAMMGLGLKRQGGLTSQSSTFLLFIPIGLLCRVDLAVPVASCLLQHPSAPAQRTHIIGNLAILASRRRSKSNLAHSRACLFSTRHATPSAPVRY